MESATFFLRDRPGSELTFAIPNNFMNYSLNIICLINYYWPQVKRREMVVAGENGPFKTNLIQIRYPELVLLQMWFEELRWQLLLMATVATRPTGISCVQVPGVWRSRC